MGMFHLFQQRRALGIQAQSIISVPLSLTFTDDVVRHPVVGAIVMLMAYDVKQNQTSEKD